MDHKSKQVQNGKINSSAAKGYVLSQTARYGEKKRVV
jgi:hypothetical protein